MSDSNVNPFENTNSGPSVLAPEAKQAGCPCPTSGWRRAFLYAPIAMLVGVFGAFAAYPQLADYASPVLNLISPNVEPVKSCSSGSCCSHLTDDSTVSSSCPLAAASAKKSCCSSSRSELTSIEVSEGDLLEGSTDALPDCYFDGSPCCEDGAACESADGVCPLAKARAEQATEETAAEETAAADATSETTTETAE